MLKSLITKNKGKLMKKCLEQLIDKHWHLHYSLNPEFYIN